MPPPQATDKSKRKPLSVFLRSQPAPRFERISAGCEGDPPVFPPKRAIHFGAMTLKGLPSRKARMSSTI